MRWYAWILARWSGGGAEARRRLIDQLRAQEQYPECIALGEWLLRFNHAEGHDVCLLIFHYLEGKKYQEALELYEMSQLRLGAYEDAPMFRAAALAGLGRREEALAVAKAFGNKANRNYQMRLGYLGRMLATTEQEVLDVLGATKVAHPALSSHLALCCIMREDYQAAYTYLNSYKDETYPEWFMVYCSLLYFRGDRFEALQMMESELKAGEASGCLKRFYSGLAERKPEFLKFAVSRK